METFNFGKALELLSLGKSVARTGWNGKDMFLTLQVPDEHSKMTKPYIYITTKKEWSIDRIPWLASQSDLLNSDWFEVTELPTE